VDERNHSQVSRTTAKPANARVPFVMLLMVTTSQD
jgi:hypothetical protein